MSFIKDETWYQEHILPKYLSYRVKQLQPLRKAMKFLNQ